MERSMLEQRKIALANWRKALLSGEAKTREEHAEMVGIIRNLERMIARAEAAKAYELAEERERSRNVSCYNPE